MEEYDPDLYKMMVSVKFGPEMIKGMAFSEKFKASLKSSLVELNKK